jgi:lipopolysaccharide transport system permease protein
LSALLGALIRYRGLFLAVSSANFRIAIAPACSVHCGWCSSPLAMILVYTVIFAEVMKSRMPGVNSTFGFSIYLCAGVLTWGLFQEIVSRAQNVFIDNGNLLKKLSFPRIALPVIVAISALMNFLIIF